MWYLTISSRSICPPFGNLQFTPPWHLWVFFSSFKIHIPSKSAKKCMIRAMQTQRCQANAKNSSIYPPKTNCQTKISHLRYVTVCPIVTSCHQITTSLDFSGDPAVGSVLIWKNRCFHHFPRPRSLGFRVANPASLDLRKPEFDISFDDNMNDTTWNCWVKLFHFNMLHKIYLVQRWHLKLGSWIILANALSQTR